MMLYPPPISPIDNVWRHWFAGHLQAVGGTCLLPLDPVDKTLFSGLEISPNAQLLEKPSEAQEVATPLGNRKERRGQARVQRRAARKSPRDASQRVVEPESDWARALLADPRINDITLGDLLSGLDHCFSTFKRLRKIDEGVYQYFSRVGVPLVVAHHAAWERHLDAETVANAEQLPTLFGAFLSRTKETYRDDIVNDKPSFFDFEYFAKLHNNYAVPVPLDATVYAHNIINLGGRGDAFKDEQERRKYTWVLKRWGGGWKLAILPSGEVLALPMRWNHKQYLPRGGVVHHSYFKIPGPLYEMGGKIGPHGYVRVAFNVIRALTAAALSGAQLRIEKNGLIVRIGVPLARLKEFFADRSAVDGRRQPIVHLVAGHDRVIGDKTIRVGEHLRGSREFTWRGYSILITIPGISGLSPEALNAQLYDADEEAGDGAMTMVDFVKKFQPAINKSHTNKLQFHRGVPLKTYNRGALDPGDPDNSSIGLEYADGTRPA